MLMNHCSKQSECCPTRKQQNKNKFKGIFFFDYSRGFVVNRCTKKLKNTVSYLNNIRLCLISFFENKVKLKNHEMETKTKYSWFVKRLIISFLSNVLDIPQLFVAKRNFQLAKEDRWLSELHT